MAVPAKHSAPLTLAQRVARAMGTPEPQPAAPSGAPSGSTCLLLDVSGSMAEDCEPGRSKIDALREIVPTLNCAAVYAFADDVNKCRPAAIPGPAGQTYMSRAFQRAKTDGHAACVLITDGIPTEPEAAVMRAAAGLHIEIFYVGPAPKPAILDKLARAGQGRAHKASLKRNTKKQLAVKIRALLGPGA